MTQWRSETETSWLKDAPTHPLQQALKDLERAYLNFFAKRADFPRFKKKGRHDSFRYPDPKQIKLDQMNSRLFLPKLGWLCYRNSRRVLGRVKNVTLSLSGSKWFASIQTERELEQPLPRGGAVGIDLDYLHKTSTAICQNHAMVCIEDLQVGNMSRSAVGSIETPGKHVRAKAGLNRSILDQGWFEFRRQLEYKLSWNGGSLLDIKCPKRPDILRSVSARKSDICSDIARRIAVEDIVIGRRPKVRGVSGARHWTVRSEAVFE